MQSHTDGGGSRGSIRSSTTTAVRIPNLSVWKRDPSHDALFEETFYAVSKERKRSPNANNLLTDRRENPKLHISNTERTPRQSISSTAKLLQN
ncbi:hypothetical protein Q7C36_011269 [Tachysurus vachellii]|uniref:Uncharacterized protein n=1 Tax=Tachysurus vachellii TaxID=175792 RepID=A0AA88MR73_TACVA|nr:hypothetical protein Q7C36_011269 [Tachysurus vachellii]